MIPRDPLDPVGGSAWDFDPESETAPPVPWWGCLAYLAIAAAVAVYIVLVEVRQ